ncbi:type III secretion protein [Pseudomonas kairouanensis]|uniref:Type III secretion protein n=1 Tax=Pseudomonas kairouanensis TaxID=2293832 RepID=A0A4Z0AKK9_9PSED|nr:type III secretion protein [Pseudomonas kairouanensis]TFY86940.1 type III secretion protein [Pseudomonas kairouanensis]
MSNDVTWVRWWAFPWKHAHRDWSRQIGFDDTAELSRSHHQQVSRLFGIVPELPPPPCAVVLQLVLLDTLQRDLVLMLVKEVCNCSHDNRLNEEQRLWCQRLTKALAPDPIPVNFDDPLHCLRAWVSPALWQRLRLSFACQRVLELEKLPRLATTHDRLTTLWQAALWRATSTTFDEIPRRP